MHPRTPERLEAFAEIHRQVGAICNAATWLEYQLELAISELSGRDTLDETQGARWGSLVDRIKDLLKAGAVSGEASRAEIQGLLSRIKAALGKRDLVAHSVWMFTNFTKPGCVTGQRFRGRGVERRDWHPDELEAVREEIEALEVDLGVAAWNAVKHPDEQIRD